MGMALRDIYGESLVKYAGLNDRVVVLDADLSNSSKTCMMAAVYPERVFDVGIAEGNMAALGAGVVCSQRIYSICQYLRHTGVFHVCIIRQGTDWIFRIECAYRRF